MEERSPGFTFLAAVILLFAGAQLSVSGHHRGIPFASISSPAGQTCIRNQGNPLSLSAVLMRCRDRLLERGYLYNLLQLRSRLDERQALIS